MCVQKCMTMQLNSNYLSQVLALKYQDHKKASETKEKLLWPRTIYEERSNLKSTLWLEETLW